MSSDSDDEWYLVSRGLSSDGIGSPTDHAYAPPGVVTKLESIQQRKQSQPQLSQKKMICTNCNQKTNCFCKKCTLEKLKIYSRKENYFLKSEEKEKLQIELLGEIEKKAQVLAEVSNSEERLIELRKKVENAKIRNELKRVEIRHLGVAKHATASDFAAILRKQNEYLEKMMIKKSEHIQLLADYEKKLAKIRLKYCIAALRIFPVQEFDVKLENAPQTTTSAKCWAVVTNKQNEEGQRFTVGHGYINENLLTIMLSRPNDGSISKELHAPFAAFTNTVQLVHNVNVIFNFRPPVQLSHHEICMKDRWLRDEITREWSVLCNSIAYLCAYVGMSPPNISHCLPYSNLMDFGSFVVGGGDILKIGSKPGADIADIHRAITTQYSVMSVKEEEDESWFFVD